MFFKGLQFWDSFSYEYDMGFFQTQNYNIHPNAPWMEYIPTFGLNSRSMWPTTMKELTLNTGELTKSLVQPAMVFSWKNSVNFPWAPRLLLKEKYVLSISKEIWLVVSTPLKNISQIGNRAENPCVWNKQKITVMAYWHVEYVANTFTDLGAAKKTQKNTKVGSCTCAPQM